jgi:hypothetical protein
MAVDVPDLRLSTTPWLFLRDGRRWIRGSGGGVRLTRLLAVPAGPTAAELLIQALPTGDLGRSVAQDGDELPTTSSRLLSLCRASLSLPLFLLPARTNNRRAGPPMKELLQSSEYTGYWGRLQNGVGDEGGCCRAFSFIPLLEEVIKTPGAGGLRSFFHLFLIRSLLDTAQTFVSEISFYWIYALPLACH